MGYIDLTVVASIGIVVMGLLMIVGGFFARPRQPRTREGAQIAAGFLACVGVMTTVAGAIYLARLV